MISAKTTAKGDSSRLATKCQSLAEDVRQETSDLADMLGMENDSPLDDAVHRKLAEHVERLARTDAVLEMKVAAVAKAMSSLTNQVEAERTRRSRVDDAEDEADLKDYATQILMQVKKAMQGAENKALESETYKQVVKKFKVVGGDDEDLFVVNNETNLICPLTNAQFKKPVKSTKCNHTFEESAIHQHLKIEKGNAKCPVAGCAHKVTRQDLKVDKDMERKLRIAIMSQTGQEPAIDFEEIDDDALQETYV